MLPVVTAAEMRAAEEAAFARGISAEQLMDAAGAGIAGVVRQFFPRAGKCIVFAGKGNNAGDAFVAASHLMRAGWRMETRLIFPESECTELCRKKLVSLHDREGEARIWEGEAPAEPQNRAAPVTQQELRPPAETTRDQTIVLDGLLGIGAKLPLRDPIRSACREINALRLNRNAFVFAIDIPTGLETDTGDADPDAVVADFTLTIGAAKRGLIADRALGFVGRLEVIHLSDLQIEVTKADRVVATAASLRHLLPRRKFGGYKNQFGRVGIVAGSRGLTGASLLCATGALRGGAGLVDLFVHDDVYEVIAAAAPPEVMVKPVTSYLEAEPPRVDVWAVGPGLGKAHRNEVLALIRRAPQPMVIDADALTIVADDMNALREAAGPRLLTPHAGEMKRLLPVENLSRAELARRFVDEFPVTLLLKGSRTLVGERGQPLSFNTTGNPGMATGGIGDTLTGLCAALIAQGLTPYDAARVGAWVSGRAAELAIFAGRESEESLIARDVAEHLGVAFRDLHNATS